MTRIEELNEEIALLEKIIECEKQISRLRGGRVSNAPMWTWTDHETLSGPHFGTMRPPAFVTPNRGNTKG